MARIFLATFAIAALCFSIIVWCITSLAWLIFAQVLHAAIFGAYHATAVALMHRYFRGKHQARGQGIYSSMAFGADGTLGGLYAGATWDSLDPQATFMIATGFALLGFILVAWKRKALEA